MNYYAILGVTPNDDRYTIKQKTLMLKQKYPKHSDGYNQIKKAYNVLSNYHKKLEYDRYNKFNFSSLFDFNFPLNLLNNNSNASYSSYSTVIKPDRNGKYVKIERWNKNGKKTKNISYLNK